MLVVLICVVRLCNSIPSASQMEGPVATLFNQLAAKYGLPLRSNSAIRERWKSVRKITGPNSGGVYSEDAQLCNLVCEYLSIKSSSGDLESMSVFSSSSSEEEDASDQVATSTSFIDTPFEDRLWSDPEIETWLLAQVNIDQSNDFNAPECERRRVTPVTKETPNESNDYRVQEVYAEIERSDAASVQSIQLRAELALRDDDSTVASLSGSGITVNLSGSALSINQPNTKQKTNKARAKSNVPISITAQMQSAQSNQAKNQGSAGIGESDSVKRRKIALTQYQLTDAQFLAKADLLIKQNESQQKAEADHRARQEAVNSVLFETLKTQGEVLKEMLAKINR
jgi:hypothetical protein